MAMRPLIFLVDDDESVRESLPDLLREFGYEVRAFSAAKDFLVSDRGTQCDCLILDIAMPEMSGTDLLAELKRRRRDVPTVFITAQFDEKIRPLLLGQGAVDCLFKPFSQTALLGALELAIPTR